MSNSGSYPRPDALYHNISRDAIDLAKVESDGFKRRQLIATSLVFSALCLEVFINQEYASHPKIQGILEDNDHMPMETK